ncbi:MotA/TolQ/ExbB proton channel family protein [Thermovibrio sp.]
MIIDIEVAHKAVFYALFFLLFLATVVFIERLLYFFFTLPAEKKLLRREVEGQDRITIEALYHSYASKVDRGKGALMFVITASPLLGLLGTVLGIMNSFSTMAQKGVSDIAEVSKGIAFALEATALGITVSLIALFFYYIISGLSRKAKEELKLVVLKAIKVEGEA